MIERFLELSELISIIILENKKCDPMLSAVELYTLKEFLEIFKPFEIATKIVCGEKFLTASKIIPITRIIELEMTNFDFKTEYALEKNRINRLKPKNNQNILFLNSLDDTYWQ